MHKFISIVALFFVIFSTNVVAKGITYEDWVISSDCSSLRSSPAQGNTLYTFLWAFVPNDSGGKSMAMYVDTNGNSATDINGEKVILKVNGQNVRATIIGGEDFYLVDIDTQQGREYIVNVMWNKNIMDVVLFFENEKPLRLNFSLRGFQKAATYFNSCMAI